MAITLQFKYMCRCHCGASWEGEAGKCATDSVVERIKEFFEKHHDCLPKKKKRGTKRESKSKKKS